MNSKKLGVRPDLAPTPASGGVAGINVTPLIDVLLVLLIIALVSLGLSRRSLPIVIPTPVPGHAEFPQIVLELADDGGYLLNKQPVPGSQLADILGSIYRSRPVRILFIKTGKERTYQEFIQAADLARGAGVAIVAVIGEVPGPADRVRGLDSEASVPVRP